MDLDSPFMKTALIQGSLGEISEKTVQKGKVVGDMIEFEKEDNSLLVLPKSCVLAVLPRIPASYCRYLQSDSVRALQVLEQAQKIYPARIEVSTEALAKWRKMSERKTETDQAELQALQAWFLSSGSISPQAKQKEVQELVDQGEVFADKFPDQAGKILEQVKGLRELSKIDLSKVANLKFPIGSLGENFVPGAVLWGILLIPLIFILQGLMGAIQGFKEGLPLAGLLRSLVVLFGIGFMAAILRPTSLSSASALIDSDGSRVSAERAFWLSRNLMDQWGDQGAQRIIIPLHSWADYFFNTLEPGLEDLSTLFWRLEKPRVEINNGKALVLQPAVMKMIPIYLWFQFKIPPKGQAWDTAELDGFRVGSLPLGNFMGTLVLQTLSTAFEAVRSGYALDKGARWMVGEGGSVVVEVPAVRQKRPQAKDSITARELAGVYSQGFGEIYKDRYINVEGVLEEVHSSHDTLGMGVMNIPDALDEFYLTGMEAKGGQRRIRICCKIKSQERSYFLDGKGDLYYKEYKQKPVEKKDSEMTASQKGTQTASPALMEIVKEQIPGQDQSIFRKGGTIKFSGGRVESSKVEMESVVIYDCQKVEVNEGGKIKTLWEASH